MLEGPRSLEALRRLAAPLSLELSAAELYGGDNYRLGYVRFLPRRRRGTKLIVHEDLDVVGVVVAGQGRLRLAGRSRPLVPGTVCRIPAGTPHDFSATTEPLELVYSTIRVSSATA